MKKGMLMLLLFSGSTFAKAQDAKTAINATEIVWYGLDFSQAKFVGEFEIFFGVKPAMGPQMRNKWIPNWNSLVMYEPYKFDVKETFHVKNVITDMKSVEQLNKTIDTIGCMVYNPAVLERTEIEKMVSRYQSYEKKEGIGVCFIVENFNSPLSVADIYVTYFDIATKKVLICEKVRGRAEGVTMRNMWAGAIYDIFKQVKKKKYKTWKKMYGK